jgi:dTMP kinase
MYLVFEGVVGTGKTTQSKKLVEHLRQKYPKRRVVWTYEPGGTEIAQAIRKLVQGTVFKEEMDSVCEAYLYAASRAQMLRKVVGPALEKGGIVVSDRSFVTSLAFQTASKELTIERVLKINKTAVEGFMPDLVFFLDLDIKEGLRRARKEGKARAEDDKWEAKNFSFFQTVAQGYARASKLPMFKNKWINIDASGSRDEVFERILAASGF